MALTPTKSAQYTLFKNTPSELVSGSDWDAKLRYAFATLTHTAAGQGTAQMIRLPAGFVRIITDLSRIVQTVAGTATSDLHVGNAAFTKADGTAGAADDNALADNVDAGATIDVALSLPASGFLEFESRDGVDIEVMVDTADGPASGDLLLMLAYQTIR